MTQLAWSTGNRMRYQHSMEGLQGTVTRQRTGPPVPLLFVQPHAAELHRYILAEDQNFYLDGSAWLRHEPQLKTLIANMH